MRMKIFAVFCAFMMGFSVQNNASGILVYAEGDKEERLQTQRSIHNNFTFERKFIYVERNFLRWFLSQIKYAVPLSLSMIPMASEQEIEEQGLHLSYAITRFKRGSTHIARATFQRLANDPTTASSIRADALEWLQKYKNSPS